uniref:ATP-dependent DNA helicase n=1 Tax=Zea mays TaxID=4577 RepID=A0A804R097_MAIZE
MEINVDNEIDYQTTSGIDNNESISPSLVPSIESDKMAEGADVGMQHQTTQNVTTNEDDDEAVFDDDDEEEGYLFVGQDDESGEDIKIYETQDAFTVTSGIPDSYDKVFNNMPEETHLLNTVADCNCCKAKKFQNEPPEFYCCSGQVDLAPLETPSQLRRLWECADVDARHFRDNIRFFNDHFLFTSLYCCLDSTTTNMDCGVYTFRAHGTMYHNIRSFGRQAGSEHKHLELYFYDDDPSLEHRYCKCRQDQLEKDKSVIKQLVDILRGNPYSEHLRSELGWHANIPKSNVSMDKVDAYHLRTLDGDTLPSFREAAQRRGLLEADDTIDECLNEAAFYQIPSALQRLFATILVYFNGEDINTFHLPAIIDRYDDSHGTDREIYEEQIIEPTAEDVALKETLNEEQRSAYDKILSVVDTDKGGVFFMDGPGGTGKTYLYKALLASLRS